MDTTSIGLRELPEWDDEEPPDELRVPLTSWTDPAAPTGDGIAERHIVRSID
jgi:hypothetical protein